MSRLPWYKWHTWDWLTCVTRLRLSLAARGAYRDLLDYCNSEGSIPADEDALMRMLAVSREEFDAVWPAIRKLFTKRGSRLIHLGQIQGELTWLNNQNWDRLIGALGGERTSVVEAIEEAGRHRLDPVEEAYFVSSMRALDEVVSIGRAGARQIEDIAEYSRDISDAARAGRAGARQRTPAEEAEQLIRPWSDRMAAATETLDAVGGHGLEQRGARETAGPLRVLQEAAQVCGVGCFRAAESPQPHYPRQRLGAVQRTQQSRAVV